MTEFTRRGKHGAVQVTIGNCELSCSWVSDGDANCGECHKQPFRMREHLVKAHAKGLVKHPFVCPTCRKCSRQKKGLSQCPCHKPKVKGGADTSQIPATLPNPNQTSVTDREVEILDRVAASLYPLNNQQHLDTAVATIDWANSQIGHIQRKDRQTPKHNTNSNRGTQPPKYYYSAEGISSGMRAHAPFPSPPPMDPNLLADSHDNVDPEDDNIDYDDDDDDDDDDDNDSEKGGVN